MMCKSAYKGWREQRKNYLQRSKRDKTQTMMVSVLSPVKTICNTLPMIFGVRS